MHYGKWFYDQVGSPEKSSEAGALTGPTLRENPDAAAGGTACPCAAALSEKEKLHGSKERK